LYEGKAATEKLGIATTPNGDFIARGQRFSTLAESALAGVLRIATARVHAVRWILGDDAWQDVSLDS
jgi:hypothetical protein